ncbi:MmpS family transport accessory protein [Allosaccharopolyspora coralli]|nr:MmpS family transport accessory protein [Allosaccharopolyspora coralli]
MASYYTDPTTGQRVKIEKTHRFRNFVVIPALGLLAVIVVAAAAGAGGSTSASAGNGSAPEAVAASSSGGHVVRYEITGGGEGMITFTTDSNMSHSQSTESLPWSTEITMEDTFFAPVSVSATRSYQGGTGPLGCTILVDGEVISENHSSGGEFATVSCHSTLE